MICVSRKIAEQVAATLKKEGQVVAIGKDKN